MINFLFTHRFIQIFYIFVATTNIVKNTAMCASSSGMPSTATQSEYVDMETLLADMANPTPLLLPVEKESHPSITTTTNLTQVFHEVKLEQSPNIVSSNKISNSCPDVQEILQVVSPTAGNDDDDPMDIVPKHKSM